MPLLELICITIITMRRSEPAMFEEILSYPFQEVKPWW